MRRRSKTDTLKVLFISPRNSQKAHINLFEKTDCRVLWFSESFSSVVAPWLKERDMQTLQVKPLAQWFPAEQAPHFPYEKTFDQAEWEPFCVLHTSGSTGLPKPITVRTVRKPTNIDMFLVPFRRANVNEYVRG
jgi:acyl-coenzyme A synthetase/AMP-(fatty) acid ligase